MEWQIYMQLKGCESIECWTHAVTFNGHLTHDLYLGFSRSKFEKVVSKGMWVDRMLQPLCDFEWPLHPWPWPWIFQGQILKMLYLRNGREDWHGTKGIWVDRILDPCCDFPCSLLPWPWPWIFKVKFWKSRILGMGWPIDMERKGCESIEC